MADRIINYLRYALIVVAVVLGALAVLIVQQYFLLRRAEFIEYFELHHAPLNGSDVGVIRSWMTFDYVNKLFDLPPSYLQGALNIQDARYPHITLSEYAESAKININTFIIEVESALSSYFSGKNA